MDRIVAIRVDGQVTAGDSDIYASLQPLSALIGVAVLVHAGRQREVAAADQQAGLRLDRVQTGGDVQRPAFDGDVALFCVLDVGGLQPVAARDDGDRPVQHGE